MAFKMDFKTLPRCSAKARSNFGLPCRQAAIKAKGRCHWHGGKAVVKHGRYSKKTKLHKINQRIYIGETKQALHFLSELINEKK